MPESPLQGQEDVKAWTSARQCQLGNEMKKRGQAPLFHLCRWISGWPFSVGNWLVKLFKPGNWKGGKLPGIAIQKLLPWQKQQRNGGLR